MSQLMHDATLAPPEFGLHTDKHIIYKRCLILQGENTLSIPELLSVYTIPCVSFRFDSSKPQNGCIYLTTHATKLGV